MATRACSLPLSPASKRCGLIDEWAYHFVLANPHASFEEEQAVVDAATGHLEGAFAQKRRTGSDITLAAYLKDQGYVSVEGFKVIDDFPGGQKQ